jgi:hypothetical protein
MPMPLLLMNSRALFLFFCFFFCRFSGVYLPPAVALKAHVVRGLLSDFATFLLSLVRFACELTPCTLLLCDTPQSPREMILGPQCACVSRAVLYFPSLFCLHSFCRSTVSEGLSLPQCAPVSLEQSSFVLFFCTMLFLYNAGVPSPKGFHCRNVLLFR